MKIPGAQPTTPAASTASAQTLHPGNSAATDGTCGAATQPPVVNPMPHGDDAKNVGAPDVIPPDEQTREDSSPVRGGYESLGVDATRQTFEQLDGVLGGLTNTIIHTIAEITPHLAAMQSLLSQRGADRKKVLKQAGVPTWTKWAKAYATTLRCSMRTIQSRIKSLRQPEKHSGTKGKPLKLDRRQQRALVTAQVAANDLAAALKNAGDWQTALAEYERVAVSPKRLDGFLSALDPGPDWQELLRGFLGMVQQNEDRLSEATVKEMRRLQQLSGGTPDQSCTTTAQEEASTGMAKGIPIPGPNPQTRRRHQNVVHSTELPGARETHPATETSPSPRSKSIKPPKVTSGAPVTDAESEGRGDRVLSDAGDYMPSAITGAGFALTADAKLEYVGKPD